MSCMGERCSVGDDVVDEAKERERVENIDGASSALGGDYTFWGVADLICGTYY